MSKVTLWLKDEINCVILGVSEEHNLILHKQFGFKAKNYFFNPKYKLGVWDGQIHFYSKTGLSYIYLLNRIIPRLRKWKYEIVLKDDRKAIHCEPQPVDDKVFAHISNEHGDPYMLRWYQRDALNAVLKNNGGIMIAGTGAGKALTMDSKLKTPTGWMLMKEVSVGDELHDPITGDSTKVIGVYPQGIKDAYEIEFHDGSKLECCLDHLWEVKAPVHRYRANTERKVISTQDIVEFLDDKNVNNLPGNISIPLTEPTNGHDKWLEIPPYLLGALLGDGGVSTNAVMFSNTDDSVMIQMQKNLDVFNYRSGIGTNELSFKKVDGSSCDYRVSGTKYLTTSLEVLNLMGCTANNKFIPELYKTAKIFNRLELIRGLMDTDGTVDARGNCSFTSVSHQLALDVQEIIWSLGGTCTITSRFPTYRYDGEIKTGQKAFTLHIRMKKPKTLFHSVRKLNRCRETHANGRIELMRRVKSVTHVGSKEMQCIAVDSERKLFVADDYIVTHNTIMGATLATVYEGFGFKTITIVPSKTLVFQSAEDYKMWGLDCGQYCGDVKELGHKHMVTTWQSLQNVPTILRDYDVVNIDECHGAKASVLMKLLKEHGNHIGYRFGMTGTMPDHAVDNLQVRLTLGDVHYEIPAHTLIDEGFLSTVNINVMQLEEKMQDNYFPDYSAEMAYLRSSKERTQWIADLTYEKSQEKDGNVLMLVSSIPFGKKLTKLIPNAHFVYGADKTKARKEIYDLFKSESNLVVVTTVQVAGTGLSIDRIFNLMFVDIGKSFVRVIQAIGRGLRKSVKAGKSHCEAYDICSTLKYSKQHLRKRNKYYRENKYPFKKKKIDYIKEDNLYEDMM